MKKVLAVIALAMCSTAFAGGVNFEFEREKDQSSNVYENSIKVAPFVKLNNGVKLDVQFTGSRQDGEISGSNNNINGAVEARAQKLWQVAPRLYVGARLGIGEKLNGTNKAGNTTDYSYYTIEPKAEYMVTEKLSALASWRYRDSFSDSVAYQTRTWKMGAGYALTKQDVIEAKYLVKRGDSDTNGVELAYTRSF